MQGKTSPPRSRLFIPSASFEVILVNRPGFVPRFRLPGAAGHRGSPQLWVPSSMPSRELLRWLAVGELLLHQTRN